MRYLIRDLAPGQEYAIRFRSNNGEEVSEWSQVQRFTTTDDIIAPSQPTNLSWYASGTSFIGQWEKVTTQDSTPVSPLKDFRHYRCNITDGLKSVDITVTNEYLSFGKDDNIAAFGTFKSTLTLRVYCVDNSYNESLPAVASVNPANPPVPSAPALKPYFGSLIAEWNGKDSSGGNMPVNLDYLEVHIGTSSNFTPNASTLQTRLYPNLSSITQRALLSGLTNDTDYYARFVAVNLSNKKSNPSAVSNSAHQARLSGLDIQPNGIGTDQINFTARDLGGANAFYGTTQPQVGVNGVTVIKTGDIWFDTNLGVNGGKTYRYDGTNFVEDPTIGVISGKKIITNTLTADAVGTNLLITNAANIGNAVIDSASLTYVDAGKVNVGLLQSSFLVNYGGVPQPAFSFDMNGNATLNNVAIKGQAVVGSSGNTAAQNGSFAIRSYNYVANNTGWTINGDGTVEFGAAVLRGSFRTSADATKRRIEIGTTGNEGRINFITPAGNVQWVRSLLFSNEEAIQLRAGEQSLIMGTSVTNWTSLWGWRITGYFRDDFTISSAGDDLGNTTQTTRLRLDATQSYLKDANGYPRFFAGATDTYIRDINNKTRFYAGGTDTYLRAENDVIVFAAGNSSVNIVDKNGVSRFRGENSGITYMAGINPNSFFSIDTSATFNLSTISGGAMFNWYSSGEMYWGSGGGHTHWTRLYANGGNAASSGRLMLFTGAAYGAGFKVWQDGNGARIEARWWDDSGFAPLYAAAFTVNSDATQKDNIAATTSADLHEIVKQGKVRSYTRKKPNKVKRTTNKKGETVETAVAAGDEIVPLKEYGFVAQESPKEILGPNSSDGTMSVDLYQTISVLWGSQQHMIEQIDSLKAEIENLRKGKNK
jgi:hypothetical protein